MGVRRAVDLAISSAEEERIKGGRVYTLGPLIHNPAVLADLESRGVYALAEPPDNPENSSLIIRAHGIDPRIEEALRGKGGRIIDATCPKVKASQLKARDLVREGFALFLAGEARHAEIAGITGYADYYGPRDGTAVCLVVSNAAEAAAAAKQLYETDKNAKTALIGQTTISEEEYAAAGAAVKKYFPSLLIVQTICAAARDRRQSLRELLDKVEAVIIAGGKESANTRRLLAIAREYCGAAGKPCALAESAAEIPPAFYACETVGLCAGASTPDSVIDEIENQLTRSKER
jgi:4-hydroxy-3-methylbut-2-enyl diphosphate reductase